MWKTIFSFILSLLSVGVYSQNVTTQTIRWQTGEVQEVNSGRIVGEQDKVVSYGATKIEWLDAQGVVKKTFIINETNGSWTNVQNNGSILYEVKCGEQPGTVSIIRRSSEFLIRIVLIKTDDDPDIYELSITNFETL